MYCNKLRSIVEDDESIEKGINLDIIRKLDYFLKSKVGLKERDYINPIKFAIEMEISEATSIMTFVMGWKKGLFISRAFFTCDCRERIELTSTKKDTKCSMCEREILVTVHKDRIALYFKLNAKLTDCGDYLTDEHEDQIDYLGDETEVGKPYVSYNDVERIVGVETAESLIVSQRDTFFENYILGDNNETN